MSEKSYRIIKLSAISFAVNIAMLALCATQNKAFAATIFTFLAYLSLNGLRSGFAQRKLENQPEPAMDSKDIYLTKNGEIIGLHAIGYAGPYEYDLVKLDGTTERKKDDFMQIEVWGNEYDKNHNMLGRGSFRVFQNLEAEAKDFEADGWVRCEAPKKVGI